jgi:hypothetical protein
MNTQGSLAILAPVPYEATPPPPFDPDNPKHHDLIDFVHRYRSAGWFEGDVASDEDVTRRARERWWAEWEQEVDTAGSDDGIFLCFADPTRAIWFDPEADTCEENATYLSVLDDLAALTGGPIPLEGVSEDWQREPGRVYVTYRIDGVGHELALHQNDDWVDPKIIEQINRSLPPDGRRFYVFDGGGQAFAITWATAAEADALNGSGRAALFDRAPDLWPGIR